MTETPRVPTTPDDFGEWGFIEPLYEGLARVIERDIVTALQTKKIFKNQRGTACDNFDKVPVLVDEDYATSPPYLILSFQVLTIGEYQSPRQLSEVQSYFLDVITDGDSVETSNCRGLKLVTAALKVLMHAKSRDFWIAENPASGVQAEVRVRRVRRLPGAVDTNKRGLVQTFRIEFDVALTEISQRF